MRSKKQSARAADGFTLVEILLVVVIILVLVSVLVVGVGSATEEAYKATTLATMESIARGIEAYKTDLKQVPNSYTDGPANRYRTWQGGELLTLAMLGYDDERIDRPLANYAGTSNADRVRSMPADLSTGLGFRTQANAKLVKHPTTGQPVPARLRTSANEPPGPAGPSDEVQLTGKVYGPYLEESFAPPPDNEADRFKPRVFKDSFGAGMIYFKARRVPRGKLSPSASTAAVADQLGRPVSPTASEFIVYNIDENAELIRSAPSSNDVPSGTAEAYFETGMNNVGTKIRNQDYVLISAGPDRLFGPSTEPDDGDYSDDIYLP